MLAIEETVKSKNLIIHEGYLITSYLVEFKPHPYKYENREVTIKVNFIQKLVGNKYFPFISAN